MSDKTRRSTSWLVVVLACARLVAAQAPDRAWQTIYVKGGFSFALPADMRLVEQESSIGVADETGLRLYRRGVADATYLGGRMRLSYDFTRGGAFAGYEGQPNLRQETMDIDGRRAKIVTHDVAGTIHGHRYFALMFFVDEGKQRRGRRPALTMWASCASPDEQEAAKRAFRSVKFLPPYV